MDHYFKDMTMKDIGAMLITPDQFVEAFNDDGAVLLDVRFPVETQLWGMKFAIEIPINELEDRLDELPKDKTIVCSCPLEIRSTMVSQVLRKNGFEAKVLMGGLIALAERLRGGAANDLKVS